jgi:regulator of nucleoside diphosphate kinase
MKPRRICISTFDRERLEELLAEALAFGHHDRSDLEELATELERARAVKPDRVPSGLVTMNSRIVLRDLDTGDEKSYSLVFPSEADIGRGAISVLAPIGTAVLGYAEGDELEWPLPSGKNKRMRIEKVTYQPEAEGDFHL